MPIRRIFTYPLRQRQVVHGSSAGQALPELAAEPLVGIPGVDGQAVEARQPGDTW